MDWNNGLWGQINKLEPVQFKPLTSEDLTKALMEIKTKPVSDFICIGSEVEDFFWDLIYDKFITVYGVKLINTDTNLFIYEGILFDKFPNNYNLLYVSYRNRFNCERAGEVEVLELTDTKIVFKCPIEFPKNKNNIILQWN